MRGPAVPGQGVVMTAQRRRPALVQSAPRIDVRRWRGVSCGIERQVGSGSHAAHHCAQFCRGFGSLSCRAVRPQSCRSCFPAWFSPRGRRPKSRWHRTPARAELGTRLVQELASFRWRSTKKRPPPALRRNPTPKAAKAHGECRGSQAVCDAGPPFAERGKAFQEPLLVGGAANPLAFNLSGRRPDLKRRQPINASRPGPIAAKRGRAFPRSGIGRLAPTTPDRPCTARRCPPSPGPSRQACSWPGRRRSARA